MQDIEALQDEQLQKLHEYIHSLGHQLEGDWRCRASIRDMGSRAGSIDTWFTGPKGEVFRSKVAVRVLPLAGLGWRSRG